MANKYGSKTVQVLSFQKHDETVRAKLDSEKIGQIVRNSGAENIPLIVISVAGLARSGKSFLLNFMITFIRHTLESPEKPFKKAAHEISGVNWTRGDDTVTKGMWIWEKAFVIPGKDNAKIAVLLMDTQGLGDAEESAIPIVDSQIIYLSLLISTVNIHNIEKYWRVEDRRVYEICKVFEELENQDSMDTQAPFNSLILLFRNWSSDDEYGPKAKFFQKELEKARKNKRAEGIMVGIQKSFKTISTYAFPEPSDELKKAEGSIQLQDVGQNFLNHATDFCCQLFHPEGLLKEYLDKAPMGKKFIENMKALEKRLVNTDWPAIESPVEQLKDLLLSHTLSAVKEEYEKNLKLAENCENLDGCKRYLSEASETASKSFEQKAFQKNIGSDDPRYSQYLQQLKRLIEKETKNCLKMVEQRIIREKLEEDTRIALAQAKEAKECAKQANEAQAILQEEVKQLKDSNQLKEENIKVMKQEIKDRDKRAKEEMQELKDEMTERDRRLKEIQQQSEQREQKANEAQALLKQEVKQLKESSQLKEENIKVMKQEIKDRDKRAKEEIQELKDEMKEKNRKLVKIQQQSEEREQQANRSLRELQGEMMRKDEKLKEMMHLMTMRDEQAREEQANSRRQLQELRNLTEEAMMRANAAEQRNQEIRNAVEQRDTVHAIVSLAADTFGLMSTALSGDDEDDD